MIPARKLSKCSNCFYHISPKIWQTCRILHDFCQKNTRILLNNCPKIFSPNFREHVPRPLPPSSTPMAESRSGSREPIHARPLPYSLGAEIEMPNVGIERCSSHYSTKESWGGGVVNSYASPAGAGAEPCPGHRKWICAYLRSEKSRLKHLFQYFWATVGPLSQTSWGPWKTSPFLPSRRASGPAYDTQFITVLSLPLLSGTNGNLKFLCLKIVSVAM